MIFRQSAKFLLMAFLMILWLVPAGLQASEYKQTVSLSQASQTQVHVPILLYHRFGATFADSMTVTTPVFKQHLEYLMSHGYTVIPLRTLVNYYLHKGPPPPPKSVVITEDDAHISVYTDMLPLVKKYHIPVTIFVYPSAVSNAKYAMTWDQLRELEKTGLFDIQGHTFWHPNFKRDYKKLSRQEYEKFVDMQLGKSKAKIEKEMNKKIDMLAWPFGIYDDYLISQAARHGYVATFTIVGHSANGSDTAMKLPRYLLNDRNKGKGFEWIFAN